MHRPSRPKSAKGRTRPNRYTCSEASKLAASVKSEQQSTTKTAPVAGSDSPSTSSFDFPRVGRPVSSLSKYRILPSISSGVSEFQSQNFFNNLSSIQAQNLDENQLRFNNQIPKYQPINEISDDLKIDRLNISDSISETKNSKKIPISLENNQQLLIALKLPDGTRVEKYFHPNDTPKQVLISAYHHRPAVVGGPALCDLFQIDQKKDFKKHLLSDMDSSLFELGISDRTLLYVERNDYDD